MIDGGKGEEGMEVVKHPQVTRETRGPRTNHLIYIRDVIVKTMLRHKASVAFKQPVDPVRLGILNYYEFILEPMDLSTIQKRLTNRYYQSGQECLEDFQLMFCNCYVYNDPESPVVSQARDLELTLVRKLIEMEEKEQVIPDGQRMRIEGRRSTSESTLSESFESTLGEGEEKGIKLRLREMKKPEPVEEKQVIVQQQQQQKKVSVGGGKQIRMVEVNMEEESSSESDSSESSSSSSDEDEEEEEDEDMDQWYQRNKEDRRQRLIIIQNQMNLLTQQMQAVYDEEQRDEKMYKSRKRRSRNSTGSGGGGKKKKDRSRSPKVTPVKIQMVPRGGSSSSKKKTSSGGTAGEAINRMLFKMASTSTPDKAGGSSKAADKGKSKSKASDKKKSDSGKAKDKSRSSTSSSRKSSGKSSSTKKSTSKSKSQTPAVPSTSKSTPKELTLDKNKKMTPEVLDQLKLKFFKITESDVEEIIQMCSYYDYDEDSMDDDDDMLNIKALPYAAQWEIWDKVEKKIAKAGLVKVANPDPPVAAPAAVVVPSLDQQETLTSHFAQSPAMPEETPTPPVDNFNPVPIPPQPVTVLISGAMQDVPANPSTAAVTQKANQDIEDDDDEDDDTLLDIY